MAHPKSGDTISVHYTGRLENGRVFDSSKEREPLELTVGAQQVIPAFEEALTEMQPGDAKTITVPSDDAYGPHRPDLVVAVDRGAFPEHIEPAVGQRLQVQRRDGGVTEVTVADVSEEQVTLDANHPLAGETLTFDLELVEIRAKRA